MIKIILEKIKKIDKNDRTSYGPFSLNCVLTVESAERIPEWADLTQFNFLLHLAVHMQYKSYTRTKATPEAATQYTCIKFGRYVYGPLSQLLPRV